MANLFWKTKSSTKSLLETPFKTEEEFEKTIFSTSELLEDVFLIKRQIRGGNKAGIPDIIGLDSDGNVCIIEMKNVIVDASIIPQVLHYAIWAETNPDSIKSLWLQSENKPDNLTIPWDDLQVRILIIAPAILRSTLLAVVKITYQVDLIEVKRWVEGDNQLLLIDKLEQEVKSKVRPASGLQTYDEAFYKREFNKTSAEHFLKYVKEVEQLVEQRGWVLETKFNKNYCGFKAGFFNVFGIQWMGSKTFAFFFKLTEKEAKQVKVEMTKYENQWKQAVYYIKPGVTKTSNFAQLFEIAYRKRTGD